MPRLISDIVEFLGATVDNNLPPTMIDGPRNSPWRSDTCWGCTHARPGRTCDAFPEGIPEALWKSYRGHRTPYPGDNGIQFQQIPPPTEPVEIPDFLRKKPAQP